MFISKQLSGLPIDTPLPLEIYSKHYYFTAPIFSVLTAIQPGFPYSCIHSLFICSAFVSPYYVKPRGQTLCILKLSFIQNLSIF